MRRFAFRLALATGHYDVDGMMADMPASLLYEWMAYFGLEPFGWQEEEYRAALVASVIANTARNPKKRKKPFMAADFMRKEKNKASRPTQEQLANRIKTIFGAMGKKK